ncbi:hypothetical protein BSPWISOXPB_1071 [uncultured Gammaproteobacteria bacterium]|nr:hypothetical protein BSPWISOXPB_1071 [uncultured Gammaproteobacteria bacterium]
MVELGYTQAVDVTLLQIAKTTEKDITAKTKHLPKRCQP